MSAAAVATVDVTVENHGSIFLFRAQTECASFWIAEHVADDAQFFGGALVVEARYAADLAEGMLNDGLEVK